MHVCVHTHGCTRPCGSELDLCTHGTLWHINVHARSTVPHVCACLAHVCARVVPHGPRVYMHGAPWHTCAPLHQHQGCCQKLLAPEKCHLWLTARLIPPHVAKFPSFTPHQASHSSVPCLAGAASPAAPCSSPSTRLQHPSWCRSIPGSAGAPAVSPWQPFGNRAWLLTSRPAGRCEREAVHKHAHARTNACTQTQCTHSDACTRAHRAEMHARMHTVQKCMHACTPCRNACTHTSARALTLLTHTHTCTHAHAAALSAQPGTSHQTGALQGWIKAASRQPPRLSLAPALQKRAVTSLRTRLDPARPCAVSPAGARSKVPTAAPCPEFPPAPQEGN